MAGLGELERAVMDHLWSTSEPQTVRQVHEALATHRELAYTTVMTVLQRLAKKHLVIQQRDDRAHRYLPVNKREELVASLIAAGAPAVGLTGIDALLTEAEQMDPALFQANWGGLKALIEQHAAA